MENHKQNGGSYKYEALDHALDAALAKYAAVDPRMGLEERILANLRAERESAHDGAWSRWGVAAAFAAVVLVIVGLAWTGMRRSPTIAHHPPAIKPHVQLAAPQIASARPPAPDSKVKLVAHRSKPVVPANPKLDQFPSPQPLSDQEKILAGYVEAFPEHAVLLARARTEALRRDQIEETRPYSQSEGASDSDDQNKDRNSNK